METSMPDPDQVIAAEELIQELVDRGVGDALSLRDVIEAMNVRGLRFTAGSQVDTIKELDRMDAE